jgi:hypothetical protein
VLDLSVAGERRYVGQARWVPHLPPQCNCAHNSVTTVNRLVILERRGMQDFSEILIHLLQRLDEGFGAAFDVA